MGVKEVLPKLMFTFVLPLRVLKKEFSIIVKIMIIAVIMTNIATNPMYHCIAIKKSLFG